MLELEHVPGPVVEGRTYRIAFSPDSRYIARVGWDSLHSLSVISVDGWGIHFPAVPPEGFALAWSPDGQYLAYGCDTWPRAQCVFVLRTSDWSLVAGIPTIQGICYSLSWSPNGQVLTVVFMDASLHSLHFVQTSDWTLGPTPTPPIFGEDFTLEAVWSPDGQWLALTNTATFLYIYRVSDGVWIHVPGYSFNWPGAGLAWSPDSKFLSVPLWSATGRGTYVVGHTVFRAETWGSMPGFPSLPGANPDSAFSPGEGEYLAVAHGGSPGLTVVRVSDWAIVPGTGGSTTQPVITNYPWDPPHPEDGFAVDWSPDGRLLALAFRGAPGMKIYSVSQPLGPWKLYRLPVPVREMARVAAIELRLVLANSRGTLHVTDIMLQGGRVPVLWNGHPTENKF